MTSICAFVHYNVIKYIPYCTRCTICALLHYNMIKYSIILHSIFHLGAHVIEAIVSLNSHQLLRPNYSIRVVSVLVCSAAADLTVENGGCNNNEAENIQLLVSQQAHIIEGLRARVV